jgi:hypothetical protein
MCLPEPRPPRAEVVHTEEICGNSCRRVVVCRCIDTDCDTDAGANATTVLYQVANPRRHVSLRVLLRLTAMDVCCGPPTQVPAFLIA